ncbi:MAG TPA: 4-phosphoerythronate dehydrogenase [Gammaproteobacteria bacterium]|nr:4-phosphoerythronate dehydrogenase [Gammaproteobacteria bacterium]
MKIVADENIPLVENFFSGHGELLLKPGRLISRTDLADANILLVRSVTRVDQELLKNTAIKFVGSVTSGADHIDIEFLNANNISWSAAQGCNAVAVSEYVVCVAAALQKMNFLQDKKIRAAVVGVGKIGQLVVDKFKILGFDVILCDPFQRDIISTAFEDLEDLDLISFHTPLTKTGDYPTFQLVQKAFLQKQKKNCILLNAGRGEVFSFDQLKKYGQDSVWALDVWENEPNIDIEVLKKTLIATPHIAGYSIQSKYRGIEMIYQAACDKNIISKQAVDIPVYPVKKISADFAKDWRDVVLSIFDPMKATEKMKMENGFDEMRKKFSDRYEFKFVELENVRLPEEDRIILNHLGL